MIRDKIQGSSFRAKNSFEDEQNICKKITLKSKFTFSCFQEVIQNITLITMIYSNGYLINNYL